MAGQFDPVFDAAAKEWNVDPNWLRAIAAQESGGNARAVSPKGAGGLMGIMPDTGKGLGVTDPSDPVQNIWAGAKYVSEALDKEKTPEDALRYYHGGPAWRDNYGPESAAYAPGVTAHYQRIAAATAPTAPTQGSAPVASSKYDDFLQRTASGDASGPSKYDDFLKRTASGDNTPAPAPSTPPADPVTDSEGHLVSDTEGPIAVLKRDVASIAPPIANVASAVASGAARGFGSGPLGLSAENTAGLQRAGVLPPAAGGGTPMQTINAAVINPLAAAGDAVLRTGGALVGGYQGLVSQGGAELGVPRLGRDLAAIPEAFPTGDTNGGLRIPAPAGPARPNPLALAADVDRPYLPAQFQDNPLSPKAAAAIEEARTMPAAIAASGDGGPQSVGAAASRDMTHPSMIEMTPAEMKANRRQAEKADILAPAEAGDATLHVPGSLPTKAEYSGDPAVSQQETLLRQRNPNAFEGDGGRLSANNAARVAEYEDMTPSDTALQRKADERARQAEIDNAAIIKHAKPADATPALETLDSVLNDKRNLNRDSVQKNLAPYRERLFDADGNLKADPQELWGIRDDLTEKLDKIGSDPQSTMGYVKKETLAFRNAIDGVLNEATGGRFQTFLDNYAAKSQEINAGNLLREFRDKFTNQKGEVQANRFHKFVLDLAEHRGDAGIDPAMDVPDTTMQRLISIDKDLKRAGLIDLGKARGSPTNLLGTLAKGMGVVGAHVGTAMVSPGLGNIALQQAGSMVNNALGSFRLKSQTNKHLAPPPGGYRNPLAGP